MVETKNLSEPSQDRSPDTSGTLAKQRLIREGKQSFVRDESGNIQFTGQGTPAPSATPQITSSQTAQTAPQQTSMPIQSSAPMPTGPQAVDKKTGKPVETATTTLPKSVTGQPVFVERQLQMDLDKYVTDEELLQGIVSKDITKNHLNYLKATDPDKFSKAVKFLSSQDAKVRAQRIRDNIVANDVEQAEVVEPPTYQSELQKLQEQATSFYKSLIDETDKASTTFSAQDLYNQTVNTKELSAKREEANKIAGELEELQLERNKIRQQVEDQYGDDVPQAVIEAEIAKRARSFTDREMLLQSRYRTALADYQGAEQDAQTQFKLALQDAQQQEQIRWREIEMNMGIAKEAFNTQRQITQVRLNKMLADEQFAKETQLKEYRYNKELEDKVYLSQLSQEQQMAMMEYETQLKLNYYNQTTDGFTYVENDDGTVTALNKSTGQIEWDYNPTTSSFVFDMDIKRTGNNVGIDVNNPGNITADGFKTQQAKANYGMQIGAAGTYTSPNGREYYVFNSLEDGARAQREFAKRIVSGGSSSYTPDMTLEQVAKRYVGSSGNWQGHITEVSKRANANANTLIGNIDANALAEGFAMADSGIDITGYGYTQVVPVEERPFAEDSSLSPLYQKYMYSGSIPKEDDLASMGLSFQEFTTRARSYMTGLMRRKYEGIGIELYDESLYRVGDQKTQTDLDASVTDVNVVVSTLEEMKSLLDSGVPLQSLWGEGKELTLLRRDAILRAKEIYNLGVLNGPDLQLMEDIIVQTTGAIPKGLGAKEIQSQIQQAMDNFIRSINQKGATYGIKYKGQNKTNIYSNYRNNNDWSNVNVGAGTVSQFIPVTNQ